MSIRETDTDFDLLYNNVGITKDEWFEKSSYLDKAHFLFYLKQLQKEKRIKQNVHYKELCSPGILYLKLYSIEYNILIKTIKLKSHSHNFLMHELKWVETGKSVDSFLRKITKSGFKITEDKSQFLEEGNNIKFDFNNFQYTLFINYPDARLAQVKEDTKPFQIFYISSRSNAKGYLKSIIKESDSIIYDFNSLDDGFSQLKNRFKEGNSVHSIIIEDGPEINSIKLLEDLEELKALYFSNNIIIDLVPIILKNVVNSDMNTPNKYSRYCKHLEFPNTVHDYILQNVILNNCNRSRSGYFHATIR